MYQNAPAAATTAQPAHQPAMPQNYVVEHDFEGSAELTTTIVHAIADVTGVDVTEASFTLNDHVDPEALNRLFEPKSDGSPRANGQVSFSVWDHQVTVYSHGQVRIVPPQRAPPTSH
jgi:hypothetical protein